MELAKCPKCGEGVTEEAIEDPIIRLALSISALLISVAMIRTIMESPQYENAKSGFLERIKELSIITERDTEELQSWGEAYDEE